MNKSLVVLSVFLWAAVSGFGANAANYVDTSGQIIKSEDLGEKCRPTWKLGNGNIMVFGPSDTDVALLEEKLIESGMTDKVRRDRWLKSAQSSDCTNRAGLNCSAGTCSTGTCQTDTNSNGTACLCK